MRGDVETASFDWGSEGMRVAPPGTGCETFVVNDFAEPATLQVVLGPPVGAGGYAAADVSGDEPWASLR